MENNQCYGENGLFVIGLSGKVGGYAWALGGRARVGQIVVGTKNRLLSKWRFGNICLVIKGRSVHIGAGRC